MDHPMPSNYHSGAWSRSSWFHRQGKPTSIETPEIPVSGVGIEFKIGRRWSAAKELAIAEGKLRIIAIVGLIAQGRAGLGLIPSNITGKITVKEHQHLVQDKVRAEMKEKKDEKNGWL